MTSIELALDELAEARATYRDFVEAVDADLRAERDSRLAARKREIEGKVLRAFALGATIAALKRAWGTKDYRTIKNIIDTRQTELDAIREELAKIPEDPATKTRYDWIAIDGDRIVIEGTDYEVVKFEDDGGYMLAAPGAPFDGELFDAASTGHSAAIYETLKRGW